MSISRLFGSFAPSSRASLFSRLEEGEMKIENSYTEIAQSFEKGVLVICLGLSLGSNRQKFCLEQLQDLCEVILTKTPQEMIESITKYSPKPCYLIISEPKDEVIIKEMSNFPSVSSISILSKNRDMLLKWITASPKTARVEKTLESLIDSLQNLLSNLPKPDSPTNDSFQTLFLGDNGQAKNLQDPLTSRIAKLEEYLNFSDLHLAKAHFIGLARAIYKHNKEIEYIEKLGCDAKVILFLYSKQNTIFSLVNYCLKHENFEALKCSRLIIKDLKLAIQTDFHSNLNKFNGLLYKGAFISDFLWEEFSNHINQEIQIPEFFTVNKNQKPALEFLLRPTNDRKTLVTIIMPPCISRKEEGFAEIKDSEDVIFNLNSKFTVIQTTYITIQEIQFRHLVLVYSQKKTQQAIEEAKPIIIIPSTALFQKICTQCQNTVHECLYLDLISGESQRFICDECLKIDSEKSPLLCVSPYLYQLSVPDVDKIKNIKIYAIAEDFPQAKYIPFYGQKCSHCDTNANIKYLYRCLTCSDPQKNQWCQDCAVKCQRKCVVTGHEVIVERSAYRFWAWTPELAKDATQKKIKLDQPNEQEEVKIHPNEYNYADENIIKLYNKDEQISIAKAYSKLALKERERNKFDLAVKYFEKAQAIRNFITQNKPHPLQIVSLNELGSLYSTSHNIDTALEYFNEALTLSRKIYGVYHKKTTQALTNLETLYNISGRYLEATEIRLEILKIQSLVFSEESDEFADSCEKLASLYKSAQQPEKAMEFHLKASQIYQSQPLDQPKILSLAQYFHSLGDISLQEEQKENDKIIANYTKALEYYYQLEEKDMTILVTIHKTLSKIYQEVKDYQNVIQHSIEELELSKVIYGSENQKIANLYENLGVKYVKTKQYDKAVEMYLEAVRLNITLLGENSKEVKNLYKSIADVYYYQNNTELENEYRNKVQLI